jgi:Cu(I)/Ag(I) efflux system membrane fusion protein
MIKKYFIIIIVLAVPAILLLPACNNGSSNQKISGHDHEKLAQYTCPMPEDSVFSDKPGKCPKCGMDLIKIEAANVAESNMEAVQYTCPMHPEIIRDKPGKCPICGMDLVKKGGGNASLPEAQLDFLLQPTNEYVLSSTPLTGLRKDEEEIEVEALGRIAYDTRQVGTISARISGRIEKLYVRYRYQRVSKGQKVMEIYSPEMLTAQQNLLFLLKNDASNTAFINAAKEKLLLLGMSEEQISEVIRTQKTSFTITVYSRYSGHIHEAGSMDGNMQQQPGEMRDISLITEELPLKEGMYVQKGQTVFNVYNPDKAWAIVNFYADKQSLVKTGSPVRVLPETAPDRDFRAKIDFIEPFYRKESKTVTARLYFDNSQLKIPIGSQVRATIYGNNREANWLPVQSVVSLGLDKVVFVKHDIGFRAHKVTTGIIYKNMIQVLGGLSPQDSVAINAQYLMDSESFIKIKK